MPVRPPRAAPPRPWGRGRAYLVAWLLATFAAIGLGLLDYTGKVADNPAHASSFGGYLVFGAFGALLVLPTLFLVRIVPETSTSSGVRLVRRVFAGIVCGLLLGSLLGALSAAGGKADQGTAGMLALIGPIFGVIAGFVDSLALDAAVAATLADGDDDAAPAD